MITDRSIKLKDQLVELLFLNKVKYTLTEQTGDIKKEDITYVYIIEAEENDLGGTLPVAEITQYQGFRLPLQVSVFLSDGNTADYSFHITAKGAVKSVKSLVCRYEGKKAYLMINEQLVLNPYKYGSFEYNQWNIGYNNQMNEK